MDSVCNILGKWWQNNLRWVQFQYNLSTVLQHSTQSPSNSFVSCSEHKTKDIATQI